jgi:hypothetical protein
MLDFSIAQALFEGPVIRTRSANFADEWLAEAQRLINAFGSPPAGVACPDALFALPFGPSHVVVGQVAGPPAFSTLRFRLLIVGRELYGYLHDPFRIAEQFPPTWDARGELPALEWPAESGPTRRTIAQLTEVLKQNDPFFLGASQTLVDTGRIVLEAAEPQLKRVRDLWTLLPDSTRRSCWPATYAFSPELGFDLLVMPKVPEGGIPGYLSEDQARDYPESRYERTLQIVVEAEDQPALDRLLSRRSSAETLRIALYLVLAFAILSILLRILLPPQG